MINDTIIIFNINFNLNISSLHAVILEFGERRAWGALAVLQVDQSGRDCSGVSCHIRHLWRAWKPAWRQCYRCCLQVYYLFIIAFLCAKCPVLNRKLRVVIGMPKKVFFILIILLLIKLERRKTLFRPTMHVPRIKTNTSRRYIHI